MDELRLEGGGDVGEVPLEGETATGLEETLGIGDDECLSLRLLKPNDDLNRALMRSMCGDRAGFWGKR